MTFIWTLDWRIIIKSGKIINGCWKKLHIASQRISSQEGDPLIYFSWAMCSLSFFSCLFIYLHCYMQCVSCPDASRHVFHTSLSCLQYCLNGTHYSIKQPTSLQYSVVDVFKDVKFSHHSSKTSCTSTCTCTSSFDMCKLSAKFNKFKLAWDIMNKIGLYQDIVAVLCPIGTKS